MRRIILLKRCVLCMRFEWCGEVEGVGGGEGEDVEMGSDGYGVRGNYGDTKRFGVFVLVCGRACVV